MTMPIKLSEQLKELKIPYPQKFLLSIEIEEHIINQRNLEGVELFTSQEANELYEIHNTGLYKFLDRLNPNIRQALEFAMLGLPMVGFLIFLLEGGFMLQFVREGGVGMLPILLLGALLFLRELNLFFRAVVAKDHSKSTLNIDTSGVLVGGMALVALGLGSTALGIYFSANAVAGANLPTATFLVGLKESMGSVIVSCVLAALVLMTHFITRRLLVSWKAPILN